MLLACRQCQDDTFQNISYDASDLFADDALTPSVSEQAFDPAHVLTMVL